MTWFPERHARIFCAAVNYAAHRDEMGRGESGPHPMLFLRTPQSLVRAGEPLVKPANSESFDYEGELALVIGTAGRHIPRERALQHVAGWTPFLDGSLRDWQRHTAQFTPGKNFDRSGSIGPELLPAAAFGDYRRHSLSTRVNGETVQHTAIELMLHDVETLIAYISAFTELNPGDVIATGTCGGVGEKRVPQLWLKPGDVVEVEISGMAVLRNPVAAER
ncbi:fumarylacetoacetate hydrolase family protein [Sandaracinobacter sp. RS1-74]|uniref:fumarylacetoacetate hydrolase family protein n=1 Tax=Sandaracinobacteroides sayramensis TaxID=2913411 RepID=UPI001ED9E708|nr:fumarylacetoacetate hydrolase family protein [Sandaracinobacteroides sayramensis]MCG2842372.1 fumarylacetoacetate hydrolase family protein [Sandaracinobacteroides sayramensis]